MALRVEILSYKVLFHQNLELNTSYPISFMYTKKSQNRVGIMYYIHKITFPKLITGIIKKNLFNSSNYVELSLKA